MKDLNDEKGSGLFRGSEPLNDVRARSKSKKDDDAVDSPVGDTGDDDATDADGEDEVDSEDSDTDDSGDADGTD